MHVSQKIVWAEGVFLGQQHFQQWEKSFIDYEKLLHTHKFDKDYGLCKLVISHAKLSSNIAQIDELVVQMPDGRWINYIDHNHTGELSIGLSGELVDIYVALPKSQVVRDISGYPTSPVDKTEWKADYSACQDLYDPAKEREVLYAKQHFFLTTDRHYADSCCLIKVAELSPDPNGGYCVTEYIAPQRTISASTVLMKIIIEVRSKISVLITRLQATFKTKPNVAIRDDSTLSYTLLVLTLLAKYSARFLAFEQKTDTSPKALYACFSECLFELASCVGEPMPELDKFDNANLSVIFQKSMALLSKFIEQISPMENKKIELHEVSNNLFISDNLTNQLKTGDFLYLEVNEYYDNDEWSKRFERGVKVGSASQVKDIYLAAVSGVKLKHTKRPPSAISLKPGCEYFQVMCEGDYWQQVLEEGKLGLLKSKEFSSAVIQLIIINS